MKAPGQLDSKARLLKRTKRVVIKIGSSTVSNDAGINRERCLQRIDGFRCRIRGKIELGQVIRPVRLAR